MHLVVNDLHWLRHLLLMCNSVLSFFDVVLGSDPFSWEILRDGDWVKDALALNKDVVNFLECSAVGFGPEEIDS
jgi:hypothetical protein